MKQKHRWLVGGLGILTLVFGLLCLNYTSMGGVVHHTRFAQQRGWPPPSQGIVYLGMLFASLGAGLAGFVIGTRWAKAVEKILAIHNAQLLSYMKLLNVPLGLLINFHKMNVTDGVSRMILPGANL
jgi:hypothetical protein